MPPTAPGLEDLTLHIAQEMLVRAPIAVTFEALIEQMGPLNVRPDGSAFPMTFEAWPGGRWFRDLGNGDGHFWGHVQAIKRPTLLEIAGPLFMSYPAVSNVQYRLKEVEGGTLITFRHSALGLIQDDHRKGTALGWTRMFEALQRRFEGQ
jgi:uncharacterized protein YndB with AHSA1/START domain